MISKLKGFLEDIGNDYIIIDVQGVGYMVYVTTRMLGNLPKIGQSVIFFIETQVREDAIRLFGFASKLEVEWFRLLQDVQGVGAKVALAILGTLGIEELVNAIALGDIETVCRVPGIGKKVAGRIVSELKSKPSAYFAIAGSIISTMTDAKKQGLHTPMIDAISALCNLGYSLELATNSVATALKKVEKGADSAKLIQLSLRKLSK
ncbi:MAG: holliday junction DNA helicase RuvA [Candidatus Tokpelaia sp. JSC188]|nr:MAG: holliday junction DNA helicase RuvA [Candidatus Tokpelaia sp. JSC188]